ncbi:tyrosine-type recombinase/integrase [Planctomycetota bacterium]
MASLRKHTYSNGKSVYQITYYKPLPNGKKKRVQKVVGPDKRQAKRVLKLLEAKIIKNDWEPESRTDTFDDVISNYLTSKQNRVKAKSLNEIESVLYELSVFCHLEQIDNIQQVDANLVDLFLNSQLKTKKPQTVNKYLRILKSFFKHVFRQRILQNNPVEFIERFPAQKPIKEALDKKTANGMLEALRGSKFYEFCLTALLTGLRKGELLNLKWGDIDFNKSIVYVRNREGDDFSTKTRKERIVPMPKKLRNALREIANKPEYYVFVHNNGKQFKNNMYRDLDIIIKKAGLPKIRFHDLRHTYLTNLARAGVSPAKIQQWAGHSDYNVTANIYTHLAEYDPDVEKIV